MKQKELSFVDDDKNGILLYYVDDFFYISTSKMYVKRFLEIMHTGIRKYRCSINKEKSLVNFDIHINGTKVPKVRSSYFSWCRLKIHIKMLDVMVDNSVWRGNYVGDAITAGNACPGEALIYRMFDLLKHKYHTIFINPGLNSTHTILRNVYQNFLLCAIKFYCHVAALHCKNEDFLMGIIFAILNFGYSRLQSRYTKLQIPKNYCDITENHVIWLGAHAFYIVLLKKQTGFSTILQVLEQTLLDNTHFEHIYKQVAAVVER
ncbi:hypothetical protein BC936DRAFT_144190 [Jimgerdemannia flammicorona]|uniref:Telomerase reverse transcriptase n=1 Tax=Jimgerdemannia flammicorona TaxID=994334 RepID=A0A433DMP4_9FUNG|nr:hypothetical protein BC936DRAFT_144190 [Jimgerdemannia flammicorona]RUP51957.1 hypothetical protein BC936DRAFT_144190 [Jimgerdemannia flammicorona]